MVPSRVPAVTRGGCGSEGGGITGRSVRSRAAAHEAVALDDVVLLVEAVVPLDGQLLVVPRAIPLGLHLLDHRADVTILVDERRPVGARQVLAEVEELRVLLVQ